MSFSQRHSFEQEEQVRFSTGQFVAAYSLTVSALAMLAVAYAFVMMVPGLEIFGLVCSFGNVQIAMGRVWLRRLHSHRHKNRSMHFWEAL